MNGQVIDGTGNAAYFADIGIARDTIVFVDTSYTRGWKTRRTIDAKGYIVSPGFIDPHTHAGGDLRDSIRNSNINYVMQGVTTVFVGNDGRSARDIEAQFTRWESQGIGTNAVTYVGHGTVRRMVMGMRDNEPTLEEMGSMKALVRKAMEAGAIGLSSGLYYAPASYANTREVIELARVVAEFGGNYDVHIRDESSYNVGLLGAIEETIRISELAGIPGHIAHIKCLGVDVWGKSNDAIRLVENARSRGVAITADQYPYTASGTSITGALVPRWFLAGDEEVGEKLDDPEIRSRLAVDMKENLRRRGGPDRLLITRPNDQNKELKGLTLQEAANKWDMDPVEAAIEILRQGGSALGSFNMQEEDITNFMRQSWVMTGSDGSRGHPRKFGSYPKKIREYVMNKGVLTLEEMIYRSSTLPAMTFKIQKRGVLKPGNYADIIIFKPGEVRDHATFENPEELSEGMYYVLVNGQTAIDKGVYTGALAGRGLKREQQNGN